MLSVKEGCGTLSEAHLAYGQTLIRQKRFDEARVKFIEIQKLFPNSDVSDQADQYLKGIP
jgi:Flp pilus assembly protein TadD